MKIGRCMHIRNLALVFGFFPFSHSYADFYGKVVSIADGDTITILTEKKRQIKVRLENIDAPEKGQDFGTQSKNHISKLIFNKTVLISDSGTDRYGRVLGTVYLNNANINKQMVKSGYAWVYRRYLKDKSYIALEDEARRLKRGLWAGKNPIEPSQWRKLK